MNCQDCEEQKAVHHYGDIYHLCDDCNEEFLDDTEDCVKGEQHDR